MSRNRIILPDGVKSSEDTTPQSPVDGIMQLLRNYSTLTGNTITQMGDLANALAAAYVQGAQRSILQHHVYVLNVIAKTKIPDWIDESNKDHKKHLKAAKQTKEAIERAVNNSIEIGKEKNPKKNGNSSNMRIVE